MKFIDIINVVGNEECIQIYKNKLLCDVMLNLANNQQKTMSFNTGTVNFDEEKVLVKLNNGFSLTD